MKIGILYGGKSGEHEVSLLSAASVVRNIDTAQHQLYLIGINREGRWFVQPESVCEEARKNSSAALALIEDESALVSVVPGGGGARGLQSAGRALPVDAVFPVLHGTFGEDGTVQGLLEMADIPYVGGGVLSSAAAMDKEKTKQIWLQYGLPVVPFICIKKYEYRDTQALSRLTAAAEKEFSWPLFVKPCCAGSSVGAAKAANRAELEKRIAEAFLWDDKVLIEPFIDAREIECSVTGNTLAGDFSTPAYTPGEIVPSHEFYDYEAKYIDPDGAALRIPADLDDGRLRQIRETAVKAYRALDMRGMSRVAFFIE